ncbi:MAG: helicase-related protein [Anaerolineae bacterium]|nr:helicase-related protein [Anaerolineae bacterium]
MQTIYATADKLQRLVPEASIEVGHGQMDEAKLEEVMQRFAMGEFDVLVSTSIIESGLDIPNANTLIVDRSDWFGLAQLYQLRGRVGRAARRAYAYFFHPRDSRLTTEARARLETISEQTELGAGMNIAMRDLEIRGAGEVLGARQSGHVAAVGLHLYTRLLTQAVQELMAAREGKAPPPSPDGTVVIDLPLPAYVPTDYVPDMNLRLQLYRRLADLHTDAAIDDMRSELTDRFGPPPPAVENLLFQLRVKRKALAARATAVTSDEGQMSVRLPYLAEIDRPGLQRRLGDDVRVSRTAVWLARDLSAETWKARLLEVLSDLAADAPALYG